jgi:hypothetical protein
VGGELVALFHKPQAVANTALSTSTICIDLRATDLNDAMAYIKQACNSIAQKVADDKAPPRKEPDDGDVGWLRLKEVGLFKDNTWNAGGEAAFEAAMGTGRQALEKERVAQGAVEKACSWSMQLEHPAAEKEREAAEKAKDAQTFMCKTCTRKYTDGSGSGSGTKYNCGFCSSECRAAKKAPQKCEHGRSKSKCKDCGTGYCEHGRQKDQCKECGTGRCEHGRKKTTCKDYATGYCEHERQKDQCKDCGTGYCEHGRQRGKCKEC